MCFGQNRAMEGLVKTSHSLPEKWFSGSDIPMYVKVTGFPVLVNS